jgi:UDPglucose 6-dehydrogenase
MKHQSDNIRESSILDIINIISETDINVIVYEPYIKPNYSKKFTVVNDIVNFKDSADIIITNRKDKNLDDITHKLFTRDIYNTDT